VANLNFSTRIKGVPSERGGWIQAADDKILTVRIFVFPMRFTIDRAPWQDETGWHAVLDGVTYDRDDSSSGCQVAQAPAPGRPREDLSVAV